MYYNEMGVFQSEFGFPITRHETNYLNANLELVEMGVMSPIRLSGWLRAAKGDVKEASGSSQSSSTSIFRYPHRPDDSS
jgi:homocitrate synthase NifV